LGERRRGDGRSLRGDQPAEEVRFSVEQVGVDAFLAQIPTDGIAKPFHIQIKIAQLKVFSGLLLDKKVGQVAVHGDLVQRVADGSQFLVDPLGCLPKGA
jgi:hypothetical protein